MRRLCIFRDSPSIPVRRPDGFCFHTNLCAVIEQHKVDTVCEEATGLPPKSCVESLADGLGISWANIDMTVDERKSLPDRGDGDQIQDLDLFEQRENAWVERISEAVTESGLLVCGLCHAFTIAKKLRGLFDVTLHVYDPRRIYNWSGRPRIAVKQK